MKLQQHGLPRGSRKFLSIWTILLYYFCEVHIQQASATTTTTTTSQTTSTMSTIGAIDVGGVKGTTAILHSNTKFFSKRSSSSSSKIVAAAGAQEIISTTTNSNNNDQQIIKDWTSFRFKHALYNVTIPENSIGKTYAKSITFEDLMGLRIIPTHCEVKFRIISGDRDKLFKAEDRIVGDFAFLTIRTRTGNVVLNREKNEDYLLRIKAAVKYFSASNVTTFETETTVYIKVLDRNDLSPLFYPTDYSKTIPEDTPMHHSIIKVFAEDADLGVNGEIYYSLSTTDDNDDYFSIHPTTGVITLVKQLHFIENSYFELIVLANDRGSAINHYSHQASKAKVFINIIQVNLYAPEIYVKTLPNAAMDTNSLIYGIVRINDRDTGRHGELRSLEIVDGDPDGNFCLKPTEVDKEYYIQINRLAKLTQSSYNLTLRAEDKGIPAQYSYKTTTVNIMNKSSHSPVFTKELYEISIAETSPPNMPVLRLKVIDPDLSRNALVFLEIVGGNEGGEFRINPDSGMLYTQKPLDAETKAFYTLTVSAIDQTNISVRKQSSAKVKINIEDMNDNDPVFEPMNSTLILDENKPAGTFVAKVTARDKDSGENSYLTYSIANLNEVPFEIDHFSGVIRTTVLIDYETMQRNYLLSIRASDWGLPYRRQTELNLMVKIKDVNDNRPQFERVNCVGRVWRNAPVGTDLFTLSAIDFDAGDFITYRLVSGNEDGCFSLDPTTGSLSVGCDLSDVSVVSREVNVSATDNTHFSDELTMHITIVNEPANEDHQFQQHTNHNSMIDGDPQKAGYGTFECRETGVARRLSDILASAEKNNANTLKSLNDLPPTPNRYRKNAHTPEFIDFPTVLKINESLQLGETVVQIKARDRDLGYNGKLVYAITSGDYDSVFRVDADTGELQIIGYLDRERQAHYTLNITVYDLGQPQKQQSKLLIVTVLDSNDNPPVFQKSLATFRLVENIANGTVVYCLNASDADADDNAKIRYKMQTVTLDFKLNSTTGCISVNSALDREKQKEYNLRIVAKDFGVPPLTAEAQVNILLEDVNDNAPFFGVQELIFKVREDIPRGTTVATVEAVDFDSGPNGEIYFSLKEQEVNTEGLFKINKYSGVIQTRGYLDYETRQVHNLIVSAIDRGTPSLTSDMPVVIEVIDVNENRYAPEFDDFVYSGSVKENEPKGTFVMNITARDLDVNELDSKISYSIVGGDGLGIFAVNDKGIIRTLSHLDAETKNSYWITLCAQDHAIVPLSSCAQVYIKVENVNDNVPLTEQPIYYYSIPEDSPEGTKIMKIEATDKDNDPKQVISYKIITGNPEGYFAINSTTGELTTTERKLNREKQSEHAFEVSINDNGAPPLSSITRVVITVEDINDNVPEFDQKFYKVQIPSTASINESVFQVLALDNDIGENGRITYALKSGKGKNKFHIDPDTGCIYISKPLELDVEYELNIRAEDNGTPKRSKTTRLNMEVLPIPPTSIHPPVIKTLNSIVDVTETDRPGFLVTLIQATDDDHDHLWYNISAGNVRNEFFIGRDNGNVLLAKSLDWETQQSYNLTISVTDGIYSVSTSLYINVVDTNDNKPQFTERVYNVNISESIEAETIITQLHATDRDEDKKIYYTLYAAQEPTSIELFRIDSFTGNVHVTQHLDYERTKQHVLIVMARDQGTPSERDFAQIIITVHDHNDHAPEFNDKIIQCKFPESAAIGAKVVQLEALDRDSGKNAEIIYSITSGNVGNAFNVDAHLGTLTLAKPLDVAQMQEYMLQVRATDLGIPPLSSQLPVHIILIMAENDPPKFAQTTLTLEIFENLPIGTFVLQIEARSSSSVFYEIIAGNDDETFRINPSTGVILTNGKIDFELKRSYNLTIVGTNMASASAQQTILIHVLDLNDNAPFFLQKNYIGIISEAADIGTFVLLKSSLKNSPLVLNSSDIDTGINSIVEYSITDDIANRYFEIDSLTGTIKVISPLDFETIPQFKFNVMVNDMGTPKLYADTLANIQIFIEDVNDCPPTFESKESNEILYVPTYANVIVVQVKANDADSNGNTTLRYDIVDGNDENNFQIDGITGTITTKNVDFLKSYYTLFVRASDGLYSALTQINVSLEPTSNEGFQFQKLRYEFYTIENSTKISTVGLVNVVGNMLHEYIVFRILNPTKLFQIGSTSGVIKTTGVIFDRELQDNYTLVIEAKSLHMGGEEETHRRTHVIVDILILDINDNCPMFVNLPYYAIVSVDDLKGSIVTSVKAVDLDSGENGEVRYEMKKGNGELFKVDRKTGEITLKQSVERRSTDYSLIVSAYDGAITPCSTDVTVTIKIVDKSMPIFDRQFYFGNIKEDVEPFSALPIEIRADSPLQRKLIYTISKGNDNELFEIDYRTGTLYVVNSLDYETKPSHELIMRATDGVSGIYAEVTVSITVEDANDCYPSVEKDFYNVTLLENLKPGSLILKLNATDCDTGLNGETFFAIDATKEGEKHSKIFSIDATSGSLYLKSSLDYEQQKSHLLSVTVKDRGTPALSSKVIVWIAVGNINDNSPKFSEPSFSCYISANAIRGHFVHKVKAYDLDFDDNNRLIYKIVDGNELQTFGIGRPTGILTLQSTQNFTGNQNSVLNVSVTDGIHTSYARVKVSIMPENLHSPIFVSPVYEAIINENEPPGKQIVTVKAHDPDLGKYSTISYEIMSTQMKDNFNLDASSGVLTSKISFDYEKMRHYEVYIRAIDGGGRIAYTLAKIKIIDQNDNAPYFPVKEYRATVKLDVPINSTILELKANDQDELNSNTLKYTIDRKTLDSPFAQYLSLNKTNGQLHIIKNPEALLNKELQFFVKVFDTDASQMHSTVPVSILFVDSSIDLPELDNALLNLNALESTPPGSLLAKIKAIGNYTMKFSILSNAETFSITESGELLLSQTLDREENDLHYVVALAETTTTPSLFTICEIYVHVKDENDNYPIFDSNFYNIEIAENIDKVSSIFKVTATDMDAGPNGDIRYYLEEANAVSDVFDIDTYTGWITSLKELDRETQSEYYFNVLATDSGQPKHVSKAAVMIKILDYNDNPPVFTEQQQYKVAVAENALPGTVLTQFFLNDLDAEKSESMFEIIGGDNYSQFQVGKNGELFISRNLDRETIGKYILNLIATDGKFKAETTVTVHIDDVNDNVPLCIKPRYQVQINESIPIGTQILKVAALDFDEDANQKIRYYLTGDYAEDFLIEKETGSLRVARLVDREKHPKYALMGHAQDGDELERECTFEIFINVNDINDNRPEFSMQQYIVSVPEDAHIQTLLTKVHATDKDFGLNRKIKYSMGNENLGQFSVCPTTGIVKLIKELDRESIATYNISLKAEDHGKPKLYSTASLIINVLDINDNPPEFASKEYLAYLLENATISTSVTKVLATSKDIGVNAEIRYFIVGGNEQKKFRINSKTGVIHVDGEIDYEKTKNYFLTVQALDGGTPPLSSLASVNISVLDVNDNAPKFSQNLYHIQIPEDIQKHEKIIQLIATDEDSQQNGILHFHIENGDKHKQFAIDEPSGSMYTAQAIDRESISAYKIEIRVCDNGTPELCSFAQVHIDVVDVNDNAPLFAKANYSVYLRENKDIGYILLSFDISDADVPPNTLPYTFDFKQGNEAGLFRLEQDGKLRTAGRFNHKVCNHYELLIRVFDNGTPPLYSDTVVNAMVIEESQYPPLITPLEITVNSFEDEFSGGYLGQVHATDQDKYDLLQFSLLPSIGEPYVSKSLFNISSETGQLHAISNIDVGYYKVNVSVSDGKFTTYSIIKLNVELITAEMVRNAVIIRFSKVTPEEFILSHRKGFNRLLRTAMSCRQKDVFIITVQQLIDNSIDSNQVAEQGRYRRAAIDSILEVVVAIKKQQIIPNSERYFSAKEIQAALMKRVEDFNDFSNLVLEDIVVPQCMENTCINGHCHSHIVLSKKRVLTLSTDVISFAAPSFQLINECQCKAGFDGIKCDVSVNPCSSEPCQPQQQCLPANTAAGYQCICPTGYTGQLCETASTRCTNSSCSNTLTSVSFSGKSYAHYRINKFLAKNAVEKQFIYSLRVRTVQQTGTLLYASGRIDFNVLEIVNGAVQYRFDLGSGEAVVAVTSIYISDGEWHSIYLERVLNSAKLIVDKKHVSQSSAPGVNELLNIQSNDIFVGAEVRPHPSIIGFEDIQKGYIGCMADIKLSYQPLPLYISGGSSIAALKRFTNVEFICDPSSVLVSLGICGAQPCMNGGVCTDLENNTFKCQCYPRYAGKMCEIDLDPCASNPCLFGGRCEHSSSGNYTCHCPIHLSGKRCENGKFCSPNPCKNNGICEEGDGLPHCLCRGFTGPTCELDINECENQPCGNGATCINEAGSFRCICPYYLTGASCGDPLYSNSISTKLKNLSKEHLTGIISGTTLIFVILIVVLCCFVVKRNAPNMNNNKQRNIKSIRKSNCPKEHNLNSLLDKEKYCRPTNPKLSNLEVNNQQQQQHQRPLSYAAPGAMGGNEAFPNHVPFLNNLDVLQSYGSAGDELENIPFEYQKINRTYQKRNINGSTTLSNVVDPNSLQKGCCEQMHLKTFSENKLNNATLKPVCGKLIQVALPNICRTSYADDSTLGHGEYHWDCSDWIRKSQNPLPDITEVPGAEVADSSSFHSDDSNESKARNTHLSQCKYLKRYGKVNPDRDITTLNEDITSEYAESDMGSGSHAANHYHPHVSVAVTSGGGGGDSLSRLSTNNKNQDYILNTVPLNIEKNIPRMMYLHSHSYIAPLSNPSETEAESCTTGLLQGSECLNNTGDMVNSIGRGTSYNKNASNSDLSVHICEIEDLELEEFLPTDQPL